APDGPIVLVRASGPSLVVAHACPRAAAAGARPGMPLADARAMLPGLIVLDEDIRGNQTTLEHLAFWAQRFSPVVESVAPDCLLLDVSGCERVFRGEANIVRQAVEALEERRIRARAAIADTVAAAWALAHAAAEPAIVATPGVSMSRVTGLPVWTLRLEER